MPTPPVPSEGFLTSKMGPFPVWGWAGGGLGLAYAYSRYKANKAAKSAAQSSTSTTAYVPGAGAVGEPATGAPTYLIENNIPQSPGVPSAPVPTPTPAPPVTTPTGTTPSPPTTSSPPPAPAPVPQPYRPPAPGPVMGPPPSHAPAPPPRPPMVAAHTYRVQHGDTLSKIAAENHIPGGWQALWAYQLDPRNNPPQQIATLKARGPNLLFAGETIRIPAHN